MTVVQFRTISILLSCPNPDQSVPMSLLPMHPTQFIQDRKKEDKSTPKG